MNFDLPKDQSSIIKVIGVGGGGSNAVTHMHNQGITGVDFIICNTDQQALDQSPVPIKMQLGSTLTEGRGAGSKPEIGRNAAIESIDDIKELLAKHTKMVFITAGMGGGTGTGAAPIIAQAAKEMGILTVGIVTIPFAFEGKRRLSQAELGLEEMQKNVDTLLVICNDKLREMYGDLRLTQAFTKADDILAIAAKGIAEIITIAGYINVDFEDVRTVMQDGGTAIMGSAQVEGENRALKAVTQALASPLLNDNDINGADYILLNITSGTEEEISMDEIDEITEHIQNETGNTAEIIWGNGLDETLGNKISVTIIATGFGRKERRINQIERENRIVHNLDDEVETNITESQKEAPKKNILETDEPTLVFGKLDDEVQDDKAENFNQTNIHHFNFDDEVEAEDDEPTLKQSQPEITNIEDEKPVYTSKKPDDDLQKRTQERLNRLRNITIKMKTPMGLNELEKEPAYKRKDIRFDDVPNSAESNISRYSLTEKDEETGKSELRKNNSFLHDNVD